MLTSMILEPWHLREPSRRKGRSRRRWIITFGAALFVVVNVLLMWHLLPSHSLDQHGITLSATPSDQLINALTPDATPFEQAIVQAIARRGRVTVTVHVALADHRSSSVSAEFGDGDDPAANFYWGALFGVETHMANAAGWRRAYGDGKGIIRRVVFHRRAEVTPAWQARGAVHPFDLYLLACAWPASRTAAAMEQPMRDALSDEAIALSVGAVNIEFGAGSVMTGYVGVNRMLDHYRHPFAGLTSGPRGRQMGIFYVCSMSAVCLHQPAVDHGLYSVLFVRGPIVAEGYILEGLLDALVAGNLDDGFLVAAAEKYARYQEGVLPSQATSLFYR